MSHQKRIFNELHKRIPEEMKKLGLEKNYIICEDGKELIPNVLYAINLLTANIELIFNIEKSFPFKPPLVVVRENKLKNNKNIYYEETYERWSSGLVNFYRNNTFKYDDKNFIRLNKIYKNAYIFSIIKNPKLIKYWNKKEFNINRCLCCESITCGNKWAPNIFLSDLLGEYLTRKYFKTYCSSLNQRIINKIFCNDKWDLSDDIINLIFEFCQME